MTEERWQTVFENLNERLTEDEMARGWHFCDDFDGLLVGPSSSEWACCKCLDPAFKQAALERLLSFLP